MALTLQVNGAPTDGDKLTRPAKDKIRAAREHRRTNFEPVWQSNMAFAAGRQWDVYDRNTRTLRRVQDVDPRYRGKELYTADAINEYRLTVLGELGSDSDPPELLLQRDDQPSEDFQDQVNRGVTYAWDIEARADEALAEADRLCVDLGTSAIRCRYDSTAGPVKEQQFPHYQGKPVTDPQQAMELLQNGPNPNVQMLPIREGRITLDPLSPFNLLVPPGINHERYFPWEGVIRPTLLSDVQDEFGDSAKGLKEDSDIASVLGVSTNGAVDASAYAIGGARASRLRDHVWLITYYERPSRQYQDGRTMTFAGNELQLLKYEERLPYQRPDGTPSAGISYFHWWRVTGRFWSRALVEALKDGQRARNKNLTQSLEIVDRGMPFVILEEGSSATRKSGAPLEIVTIKKSEVQPVINGGTGPGPWMEQMRQTILDDMAHASGVRDLSLGENPTNVKTYSQLAQLNENEHTKRSVIIAERKRSISRIVEDIVYDMRTYWGPQKMIALAGDEHTAQAEVFNATRIPSFFIVKTAKGSSKPRSQAAELKKVEDLFNAAVTAGAVALNPRAWVDWYARSLEAGEALEMPELEADSQAKVAEQENYQMLHGEGEPEPAEYDFPAVHVPIHREAQDQARAAGDLAAFWRIQQHIDATIQMATRMRKAWRVLDPQDAQDVASDVALDEDQALKENQMMLQGIPLNPEALQQARLQVAQGLNPDTGQQLAPTDDPAALLMRASLKPTLVENLQLHLDRHGKVLKSDEFKTYPADVRARYLSHYDQTRTLWLSLPMMPTEIKAPHVTLALRESVGPSTVAKVLQRAGVPDADAQLLGSEEPMENMVTRDDTAKAAAAATPATPPEIHAHITNQVHPTPVHVQNDVQPTPVHVASPPATVHVHGPAPAPGDVTAHDDGKEIVIERDGRGQITGATVNKKKKKPS